MGRKMEKILALYGQTQYGALNYFLCAMAETWQKRGMGVRLEPATDDKLFSISLGLDGFDAVFSMNGMGLSTCMDGIPLSRKLGIPWCAHYVDHPLHHGGRLEQTAENGVSLFTDPTFAAYADKYYGGKNYVVMQAGIDRGYPDISYRERKHQVVFFGTYLDSVNQMKELQLQTDGIGKLHQLMAMNGIRHTEWEMETQG